MFLYINENYNDCPQQNTTCTLYIFIKGKKCESFLYTKIQTLYKKQDNFRYIFIYKNQDTLRYAIFHEIFEVGIYIQKA